MPVEDKFFTFANHCLYYQVRGQGSRVMLLFHGFGQDHRIFYQMASSLRDQYTLYCFDLFYHGRSSSPPLSELVTTNVWTTIIRNFLDTQGINRVSLLGYSAGSRFALSLIADLNERVEQIILLAPDSIRPNRWYQLGSATYLGRALLRRIIVRPSLLVMLIDTARKYGLIHKSMLNLVMRNTHTRRDRYWVYHRWVGLRFIHLPSSQAIKCCNQYGTSVIIYLGWHDRVIQKKPVEAFHRQLRNSHLYTLSCGHHALVYQAAGHLRSRC